MRTQSVGRPAVESVGGETSVRVGRGGRGRRPKEEGVNENIEGANKGAPDFLTIIAQQLQNLLPTMLAQAGNQRNVGNQNGNVVNEIVQENVRNLLVNENRVGCLYKEFLACNPKEYVGKGGAIVLTRRIKKMENVQDISGCSIDQKVKYTAGSFVGKALTWFHELARLVPHLVTPESRKIERYVYGLALQICRIVETTEPKTMQKAVYISGALTHEAVRNGSVKKAEKKGNVGKPSKDKNGRDDNKRTRTGNAFAITTNPVGSVPRNVNPVNARNPPVRACYECGSTDHGRGNQENQARGMAFMLGAEEAHQDSNIMTDTFTLNEHFPLPCLTLVPTIALFPLPLYLC
uniref:Reverse transcriptase domain-containing protein n=1 Tax=Tanacetum cinerariifolium TaxID=118510 RepID=A0A699KLU4_TANCI|nr:hypothetical protein [Tanacetum cinerariifolium]